MTVAITTMAVRPTLPDNKQWVKGSTLGSGATGIVTLAMDAATGDLFAVKSAPASSLEYEYSIWSPLDSPHIVRCLGHEAGHLFMEYMPGGTLADLVGKFGGSLPESAVRRYARELLLGLSYIHSRGLVHGDVKCRNVLLGTGGNCKLADFGCAHFAGDGNVQHACGTPLWSAPEVLRVEPAGPSADVWSLGCAVIEMATGAAPWSENFNRTGHATNLASAVLEIACGDGTPAFPVTFSTEGVDFLEKCLAREPQRRWSCDELLQHSFITGERVCHQNGMGMKTIKVDAYKESWSPTSVLEDMGSVKWEEEEDETEREHVERWGEWDNDGDDLWIVVR